MPDISTTSLALLGTSGGTAGLIRRGPPSDEATTGPWLASRNWLTDILSDAHDPRMNRLQQVVISLLMGYFFVQKVYNSVAMPVWTDNLGSATGCKQCHLSGPRVAGQPHQQLCGGGAGTTP